jgi:hypothetical protein
MFAALKTLLYDSQSIKSQHLAHPYIIIRPFGCGARLKLKVSASPEYVFLLSTAPESWGR